MLFISDSNIFIDAIRCGIAERMLQLQQRVCITDYVYSELIRKSSQPVKDALQSLVKAGMEVMETDLYHMKAIQSRTKGLADADCSVWECAKRNGGTMITGDMKLRKSATADGVPVHGMLYVFDEMVGQGILQRKEAAEILSDLIAGNTRLPMEEVRKRIVEWGK